MRLLNNTKNNSFDSAFSLFRWKEWSFSAIAALLLNTFLFLLLPVLIHPSSPSTKISKQIEHIQVIRLKDESPPASKIKEKPPEPPKEKPKPREKVVTTRPMEAPKLSLPFKLNTRLPKLTTDFQIPLSKSINLSHSIMGSIGMHELDAPLSPVSRIPPVYPIRARRKGLEGWVRVSFEVDTQGHVSHLQVIEAKPPGIFEKSVIACVSKWRYKPGTVEGVPVKAKMETTVRFKME